MSDTHNREVMRPLLEQCAQDMALLNRCYDLPFSDEDAEAKRGFLCECVDALGTVDFGKLSHDE